MGDLQLPGPLHACRPAVYRAATSAAAAVGGHRLSAEQGHRAAALPAAGHGRGAARCGATWPVVPLRHTAACSRRRLLKGKSLLVQQVCLTHINSQL